MKVFCRAALVSWMLICVSSANAGTDKWFEARSKNFVVVSNAGAQQAKSVAIQFEQIRELFQQSFVFANDHPTPVITILAAKDENTLRDLLPEYWESKDRAHPAGVFIHSFYQFAVALQASGTGDNPYESIYHEYYHTLTTPYFPGLPVWISEGLADFYGNSKISDKTAYLGLQSLGYIGLLRKQPLIPLPVLFQVDYASPYYHESSKISIFYAESWALVHYLMLGDNGAHRQQLITFLGALLQGQTQDEAATKAFGDLGKLQKILQSYTSNDAFYQFHTPAPAKVSEGDVKVRPLSDSEAGAYRGGFLALHLRFKEAEPLLLEASRNTPDLAIVQRNLAIFYYAQKKTAEARAALDAAIELDPMDAFTRFLRGSIAPKGTPSQLEDSQGEVDLRASIDADPNFTPALSLLAARLTTDGRKFPEAFELAKKCVSLEPGNGSYQLVLANVLARLGKYDLAQGIVTRVAANTLDPNMKANASRYMASLQKLRDAEVRNNQDQARPSTDTAPDTRTNSTDAKSAESRRSAELNRIEGTVIDVRCNVQEMVLTLSTHDGQVKLHSSDNTKVEYITDAPIKAEMFSACTELIGRTVHVKFLTSPSNTNQPYQGEISSVELGK